jgi:hypothetical protein
MNKAFEKMLAKKKADMPEGKMKARASVLDDLMSNMDERDSKKLGMGKVSVSADSPEGLEEGLEKAKEIVSSDVSPEDALGISPEGMEEEGEEDIQEKLLAKIEELEAKLAALGA